MKTNAHIETHKHVVLIKFQTSFNFNRNKIMVTSKHLLVSKSVICVVSGKVVVNESL